MLQRIINVFCRKPKTKINIVTSPSHVYSNLFSTINQQKPGYGKDVHSESECKHWSTAYALIASAETVKESISHTTDSAAGVCIEWLLQNVGCSSTNAPLWTLPYPRKIWEDTEPVKVNTAFCIPTSHSIQALVEFSQNQNYPNNLRLQSIEAATKAALHYAEHCFDSTEDGIMFWYSSLNQHSFHVTNATAMMAGQLQRVASAAPGHDILATQSDKAVIHLLNLKLKYSDGWGWNYFGHKIPSNRINKTNDLLHEAFVCHGLLDYKFFGGSKGHEYQYLDLYDSLCRFYRNGEIHEFSEAEQTATRKKHRARALAIGHSLYIASRLEPLLEEPRQFNLSHSIYRSLCNEYVKGTSLFHRPKGKNITQRVRVVGHMLLGLAEYSRLINQEN